MVAIGAAVLALGYFMLSMSGESMVYYALGCIAVGSNLFKANPANMISKMFSKGKGQAKLDGAMTLYYMAINVGSMVSLIISPLLAMYLGYGYAFLVAGLGLTVGLIGYLAMYSKLGVAADDVATYKYIALLVGTIITILLFGLLMSHPLVIFYMVWIVVAISIAGFLRIALKLESTERNRMLVAILMIGGGVLFFVLYAQMGTTLTFLAKNSLVTIIPPSMWQALNPIAIVIASPILALFLYPRWKVSHITKFGVGFILSGLAFAGMYFMQYFASTTGHISSAWLFYCYILQSVGELFISGLGVAMIAELCPRSISGFSMGIWFLSSMLAGPIGAWVGGFTTVASTASNTTHLIAYANTFGVLGVVTLIVAVAFLLSAKSLDKIIGHNEYTEKTS